MASELSREDLIKWKTLKIQIVGPYMTVMSILFAICVFTLGSSFFDPIYKLGMIVILIIAMIAIGWTYKQNQTAIDEIFKN